MKILILTQYFYPETFRITDLAVRLKARGHEITVLTGIPNYPVGQFFEGYGLFGKRHEFYKGIKIIRTSLIPRMRSRGWQLVLNYFSFAFFATLRGLFFRKNRFDAIFVFVPSPITVGLPAIVLRRILRIPVFFWVLDLWPESVVATGAIRAKWALALIDRMVNFIYQRCDKILVSSRSFQSNVEGYGISKEKIEYFPNTAEDEYQPEDPNNHSDKAQILPKGFRVMFAGNIGFAQDFETILNAAEILKEHPHIQWTILGDGRARPWVQDQIEKRQLQNQIHLCGHFPMKDMPGFFSLADVLLVTLKDETVFSLTVPGKIQSYLACSKPIIAALNGEGGEIIQWANAGISCPAGKPHELAKAVLEMSSLSEKQRKEMGESGKRYFDEHFDGNKLVKRLENWIRERVTH